MINNYNYFYKVQFLCVKIDFMIDRLLCLNTILDSNICKNLICPYYCRHPYILNKNRQLSYVVIYSAVETKIIADHAGRPTAQPRRKSRRSFRGIRSYEREK